MQRSFRGASYPRLLPLRTRSGKVYRVTPDDRAAAAAVIVRQVKRHHSMRPANAEDPVTFGEPESPVIKLVDPDGGAVYAMGAVGLDDLFSSGAPVMHPITDRELTRPELRRIARAAGRPSDHFIELKAVETPDDGMVQFYIDETLHGLDAALRILNTSIHFFRENAVVHLSIMHGAVSHVPPGSINRLMERGMNIIERAEIRCPSGAINFNFILTAFLDMITPVR